MGRPGVAAHAYTCAAFAAPHYIKGQKGEDEGRGIY